jgi:glycine/D-amino acid oxidase-like deaminating enzyme
MDLSSRRHFITGAAGLGVLGLAGCATPSLPATPATRSAFAPRSRLSPIEARPDRIINITVCLRPFRAAGPRLDVEHVAGKRVVHNYGHGGSGWSLSWGSAAMIAPKALEGGPGPIAVIGCGALGLTTAITLQRAGADVTIYAKERMPDVRSARATGVWSPDSRIALESGMGAEFPVLWEQMTRLSFRRYMGFLGLPGAPVEWSTRYVLSDVQPGTRKRADPIGFAHFETTRTPDLLPRPQDLQEGEHPFAAAYVRRLSMPIFNIAAYGRLLMSDFLQAGGRIETREFHSPADLATLKEPVVVNCTGYGARALWRDDSVIPVRGQLAWLIPQPEVDYGVVTGVASTLARRDGMAVQNTGPDESTGWNSTDETPNMDEAMAAVAAVAAAFKPPAP